jgi:hypothetical protein
MRSIFKKIFGRPNTATPVQASNAGSLRGDAQRFAIEFHSSGAMVVMVKEATDALIAQTQELMSRIEASVEPHVKLPLLPFNEICLSTIEPILDVTKPLSNLFMQHFVEVLKYPSDPTHGGGARLQLFFSVPMGELLSKLTVILGLPIVQWQLQRAADLIDRSIWPLLWRCSVRLGVTWHLLEDMLELHQGLCQTLEFDNLNTSQWAGETLARLGILEALEAYRRADSPNDDFVRHVAAFCNEQLLSFAKETREVTERAVAFADATRNARFLDAQDLIHLGIHSPCRRIGGVFLSHRGRDAKRQLMNYFTDSRQNIFLDIWALSHGDTNRRFLWRNLSASADFHAFVTPHYCESDFCMKEVEAWGLLSAVRCAEPGKVYIIQNSEHERLKPTERAPWLAWVSAAQINKSNLESAMAESHEIVLAANTALGERLIYSKQYKDKSDRYAQLFLESGIVDGAQDARDSAVGPEVPRETTRSLVVSWRQALNRFISWTATRQEVILTDEVRDVLQSARQELQANSPASNRELIQLTDLMAKCLSLAIAQMRSVCIADRSVRREICATKIVLAVTRIAAWLESELERIDRAAALRALFYYIVYGGTVDLVRSQIETWIDSLVSSEFDQLPESILDPGLILALIPTDREMSTLEVRLTQDTGEFESPSHEPVDVVGMLRAANLNCRDISVICSAVPHRWQQIATVAALSSFLQSRNYLFIDVADSGSLRAVVGSIPMEEFPHITVARMDDLWPIEHRAEQGH